jgi:hypothetical protein
MLVFIFHYSTDSNTPIYIHTKKFLCFPPLESLQGMRRKEDFYEGRRNLRSQSQVLYFLQA